MKVMLPSRIVVLTTGMALFSQVLNAQNNIQLFTPIADRASANSTSYSTPYTMGSSTISVTCSGTPSVTLARTADGTGNLLVDNNIFVTVTQGTSTITSSTNVCPYIQGQDNPGQGIYTNNCYAGNWRTDAYGENANLTSSDTWALTDGVAPIVLDSYISSVVQGTPFTLTVSMLDEGGQLASSSIYLTTSCTINGVSAGTIGGNPINGPQGSSQSFTFNPNTDGLKGVQFGYDVTGALQTLADGSPSTGAIPQVSDAPIDPSSFQPNFLAYTSFATANCMVHTGELLADGVTPACKLYTLLCIDPTNQKPIAGANCPWSSQANEVVNDRFDGPAFQLYDIHAKNGGVVHEGIGFLMASDDWSIQGAFPSSTNCGFDPNSGPIANLPCPLNLLTSFTGPGIFSGTGLTTNPNSEFISIYGIPEDKTEVSIAHAKSGFWVNTSTPTLSFEVHAPNLTPLTKSNISYPYINVNGVKSTVPGADSYRPQPVKSVSYGITAPGSVPNPLNEPISTDFTIVNSNAGCGAGLLNSLTQPDFEPAPVAYPSALPDGQYLIHYYAQDCAGTQELLFTMAPGTGVWSTGFYTTPIKVDTAAPGVTVNMPPFNNATLDGYKKGTSVYANYSCTDSDASHAPNTGSGLTRCGAKTYAAETTYSAGPYQSKLSTGSNGTGFTLSITATDGAGNSTISPTYTYKVTAN